MGGLLLKDLLLLKKQAKIYIVIVLLYMIMFSFFSPGMQTQILLVIYCLLFVTLLPITALAYDERAKWDRYALAMPVSRRDIVLSKYLLELLLLLAGVLLLVAVTLLWGSFTGFAAIQQTVLLTVCVIGGVVFLFSVLMPIMFKIGTEKGRIVMIILIMGLVLLGMLLQSFAILPKAVEEAIVRTIEELGTQKPFLLCAGVTVLSAICIVLSALASIAIYKKKEF